jgi:hypothetical protein
MAIVSYYSLVFRRNSNSHDHSGGSNIHACNHIMVALVFFMRCKTITLQHHIKRMQKAIAPFQMQPLVNDHTWMQLIHIATKVAILQPNIGVTTGLDPSSVRIVSTYDYISVILYLCGKVLLY